MKLIVLGSGCCIPNAKRLSPSHALLLENNHILFDIGSGSLHNLARSGLSHTTIQHIFLSHYHLDHIGDLQNLLFCSKLPTYERTSPLAIYGPKGLKKLMKGFSELWGKWVEPEGYTIDTHEISPGQKIEQDDFIIEAFEALHGSNTEPALSYRLKDKKTGYIFAYSGDTDYHEGIVECSQNADIALLECSTLDQNKLQGHLTPTYCGMISAQANIKKTVLVHFYPEYFFPQTSSENKSNQSPEQSIILPFKTKTNREPILGKDLMQLNVEGGSKNHSER